MAQPKFTIAYVLAAVSAKHTPMAKARAKKTARLKKLDPSRDAAITLRIELCGSDPQIWRRVVVRSHSTLAQLHDVFQSAMGWFESHLHRFEIDGHPYVADYEELGGPEDAATRREADYTLAQALGDPPVAEFTYIYDYGDDWEHRVVVEKIGKIENWMSYPLCIGGERTCPPEDVGGIHGYHDMLKLLRDGPSGERTERLQWLGGYFDADGFDANRVNRDLQYRMVDLLRRAARLGMLGNHGEREQESGTKTYTRAQGQYLAYIYVYSKIHGQAPAETDMQQYFRVTPPTVHQMILRMERLGLIYRQPGVARSLRLLVSPEQIPEIE